MEFTTSSYKVSKSKMRNNTYFKIQGFAAKWKLLKVKNQLQGKQNKISMVFI